MGADGHPPRRANRSRGDRTKGDGLTRQVEPHEEFPPNTYNSHSWILGDPEIGEGTWIGAFTVIDGSGGLIIGRGCDISSGVHIYTHSSTRRCVTARDYETVERAPVVIGDFVFIGANSVVMMGVTIGSGSIVAAGAVVTSDVPAASVVAGTPARVIGVVEPDGRTRIDGSGYGPA